MSTRQQISKQACAKYAKLRGDLPQQGLRYKLNEFIMQGLSVPEAEARALAFVRERTPGFVPVLAAQPGADPMKTTAARWQEAALRRHAGNPRGVRSRLSPP